jgi:hypothetical protein
MATSEQRQKLLGVACTWCNALPGQECHTFRNRPVTTLDGWSHDARWRTALGVSAPVIGAAVASRQGRPVEPSDGDSGPAAASEPVALGTALAERPW